MVASNEAAEALVPLQLLAIDDPSASGQRRVLVVHFA